MKIIEKIEIKNFRSFGNRKLGKVVIDKINDINIFSGSNDSGKSNILRALNLFFNKNTDLGTFFEFDSDFFKKELYDDNDVEEQVVTIKIYFINNVNKGKNEKFLEKRYLPERFWVSRKFMKTSEYSSYTQDDGIISSFKLEKGSEYHNFIDDKGALLSTVKASLKKQLTQFIESIQYHYIPAIKDKTYFSHIYGELQQTLWKESASSVLKTKEAFQDSIQETTKTLMQEFKSMSESVSNFSPAFELPSDLIDVFRSLNVNTGNVKLTLRGDGIQAKLIPEILHFIAIKEKGLNANKLRDGQRAKKYFIWGFEEPENSYEYRNAQILAERFREIFSKDIQIFLTSHSFNFISIEGKNVSTYRVYKDVNLEMTMIQLVKKDRTGNFIFSEVNDTLKNELGVFSLNKQLEKLYIEVEKKTRQLENAVNELENKIAGIEKPILITEGKTDRKHIQNALNKFQLENQFLNLDIDFLDDSNIELGDTTIDKMLEHLCKFKQSKKVIFLFDRDNNSITEKYGKLEYNFHGNNVYSLCIPSINSSLEKISIEFYYEDNDLKKIDGNKRRLFIGNEFYSPSGNSKCGNYQLKEKNKAEKLTIIDSGVYQITDRKWEHSIALSKNDFADLILTGKNGFEEVDIKNFALLLNVINKIILNEDLK